MSPEQLLRRHTDSDKPIELTTLVADDDPHFLAYLAALLRRLGMTVICAAEGEAALAALRSGVRIDLALIDFGMPKMNGLEVIRAIRSDPAIASTYAVMLTADDRLETKIKALNDGYDDFLTKSCAEIEIIAKVVASRRLVARQLNLDLQNQELYGLAVHDELTGVYNRRYFFSAIDALLATSHSLCLVLFDLDDFKKVNDTYGHLVGDRVLAEVGAVLRRSTRFQDLVARYGGDEFVMIVTGATASGTDTLAARLASEIAKLQWMANEDTFHISVTYGIASSEYLADKNSMHLLDACDRDLYARKWLKNNPERPASEQPERHPDQLSIDSIERKQAG